ncbi:hypothetical protein [Actinosynnema pretiosum]|uniref:Uncharacterized protein n=1 Tax=Actinosynnema pretiosum TaxID=42197 RepID=A0A290ZGH2_9PSEU|nr:hypothetical protein [Actinosynnema pretiosum]ATE58095.1 hypothetical protein CNX65_10360 [Actinosynnema pretiosum]
MSNFRLDDYKELATTISPLAVSQYLAAEHWDLIARDESVKEIWQAPGGGFEELRPRVMLPLATDYVDFSHRFEDSLQALTRFTGFDAATLAERIAATRADLFFVRIDQEMVDGTIPFKQAERTLEGLYKMLKAAATSAYDPTHSHKGRRAGMVNDFLDEDVRLGHTKRGSFVFTVVTRLGEIPPVPQGVGDIPTTLFPRRVMETLARGLDASRRLALDWDEWSAEQAVSSGLSASFVESLMELAEPESIRAVDLSFDWAAAAPPPSVPASQVVVERRAIEGLPQVRERLVRREQPPRSQTLFGTVRQLTREDGETDGVDTGTVQLQTEVDGRSRRVYVPLSGDDYQNAVRAHMNKKPVMVKGTLAFEGKAWRLSGDVTLELPFEREG